MTFLADTPVRSNRQAGRRAADKAIPRCWADASTVITEKVAVRSRPLVSECQALGTGRLGLCERHQRELLGVDGGA